MKRRRTSKAYENIFDAAEHGDFEAVKFYVEDKNIPLKRTDRSNQTAAHIAAKRGDLRLLRYLLGENLSILELVDVYNKPLLYRAIQSGSLEMIKYLIDECNVDIQEKHTRLFGDTALHFASELGKLTVLRYFVEEKHADVDVKNSVGETPLFSAAQEQQLNIIKYLVEERKADPTLVNSKGEHILYTVAWRNDLKLAKYFWGRINNTIDINRQNNSGDTVLNRATKLNFVEFVQYMVEEMNADVDIPDVTKMTPLHNAVRLHNSQLVSFFVDHGADIEFKNSRGKTPLDEATDYKIINYLDEAARRLSRHRERRSAHTYNKRWTLSMWHHNQWIREDLPLPNLKFSIPVTLDPIGHNSFHTGGTGGHRQLAFS